VNDRAGAARIWRARRRHDHLDAAVEPDSDGWRLVFFHNDRRMLEWRFATREGAAAEAEARLGELLRAGWVVHW
jgi:hypothetical protein